MSVLGYYKHGFNLLGRIPKEPQYEGSVKRFQSGTGKLRGLDDGECDEFGRR